ncbi:hypothetical protein M6B38_169580 [Iris pallida]|uniref:Uncharacterized protein n=1 Tax=Iris pallida TaxID=29817 RepID=A0AAX6EVG6_IRIPA|nr:hypothetical protein M6B38_169580 [Iris pallida]
MMVAFLRYLVDIQRHHDEVLRQHIGDVQVVAHEHSRGGSCLDPFAAFQPPQGGMISRQKCLLEDSSSEVPATLTMRVLAVPGPKCPQHQTAFVFCHFCSKSGHIQSVVVQTASVWSVGVQIVRYPGALRVGGYNSGTSNTICSLPT